MIFLQSWQRFLSDDGVHLSLDGSEFLFERLEKKLIPLRTIREKMPNFLRMDPNNLVGELLEWPHTHKRRRVKKTGKKKLDQQLL